MSQDLLVEGIPPSVTEEELCHLFSACGKVLAVSLEKTLEGISLGIARVQMSSPEEAEHALRSFHRVQISGCTLLVFPLSQGRQNGAASGTQERIDSQESHLQCPYCSTLMLNVRPTQHGQVEWLCPACGTTRDRTVPSRRHEPPAGHPREDSRHTV